MAKQQPAEAVAKRGRISPRDSRAVHPAASDKPGHFVSLAAMGLELGRAVDVEAAFEAQLPRLRRALRAEVLGWYGQDDVAPDSLGAGLRLRVQHAPARPRRGAGVLPDYIRLGPDTPKPAKLVDGYDWVTVEPLTAPPRLLGMLLLAGNADSRPAREQLAELRGYLSTAANALARQRAEEGLRESETQLSNILRSTADYAILTTDENFTIQNHNPVAEELFGMPAKVSPGRHVQDLFPGGELKLARLREAARAAKQGGLSEIELTLPATDAESGRQRVISLMVSAMRDPRSTEKRPRPIGYLMFARDVTEQRQRDRRLLDSQRMESIGLLAGGIAHDFNNILMGILGYASLAQDLTEPDTSVRRMLRTIEQSAERAASLTGQLMAYASGGKLASVAVDIDQLVSETLNILGSNMPRSVTVHRDYPADLPCVVGDPTQLQQVIMNLCLNAGEAIVERVRREAAGGPAGDVWITGRAVRLRKGQQSVFGATNEPLEGKFVCIQVRDNGSGMDEATLRRIFEPFFTTKFTGRGLGLSAVQGIIHNHGGALLVSSSPGEGTTFSVYLPATGRTAELVEPATVGSLEGSETILIIDDEQVARQLGLLTLANLGYQVLLAADGEEGLSVFKQLRDSINLIVLDLTMPGLSGQDVLMEIAMLGGQVPILLTSGYDQSSVGEVGEGKYLSGFLQKPYTPEQLSRAVREVLDRKP